MKTFFTALSILVLTLSAGVTPATAADLHVGETKQILWFFNPQPPNQPARILFNPFPFTVTLHIQLHSTTQAPATPIVETMTVEGDGTTCPDSNAPPDYVGGCATYITQPSDLSSAGAAIFQVFLTSGGTTLKTDQVPENIGASL